MEEVQLSGALKDGLGFLKMEMRGGGQLGQKVCK